MPFRCGVYHISHLITSKSKYSRDVSRQFGRPAYQFGHPNSGTQKTLFKFFHFNKKYVEVAINDFTKDLIILKWLRRQKCRQKRKTMKQKD